MQSNSSRPRTVPWQWRKLPTLADLTACDSHTLGGALAHQRPEGILCGVLLASRATVPRGHVISTCTLPYTPPPPGLRARESEQLLGRHARLPGYRPHSVKRRFLIIFRAALWLLLARLNHLHKLFLRGSHQ
jgi:hypothetical protein